jgi:hypothetical protein
VVQFVMGWKSRESLPAARRGESDMAGAVAKIKLSPFNKLVLSQSNVRRVKAGVSLMEHPIKPLAMMPQTHWRETDRETFSRVWAAEVAEVPEFTDSEIHIVSGLLLPIWKRLLNKSTRVYRLELDTLERIIGRKFSPAWVTGTLSIGAAVLPPDAVFALIDGKTVLDLAEGLQLRRVPVMGANRTELTDFTDAMPDRLRAYGLIHEIIPRKLRMFVPADASGPAILGNELHRHPLSRVSDRAAA